MKKRRLVLHRIPPKLAIQDVKTVSNILGHFSALFTLDICARVTTSMQQTAAEKQGNFYEIISRKIKNGSHLFNEIPEKAVFCNISAHSRFKTEFLIQTTLLKAV